MLLSSHQACCLIDSVFALTKHAGRDQVLASVSRLVGLGQASTNGCVTCFLIAKFHESSRLNDAVVGT